MERDQVEFYIKTELDRINGVSNEKPKFYWATSQCMVEVNLKFLVSIADQPERREMAGLAHGNASLFTRWGYVIDLADRAKHIIPCNECQSKIYAGDRKWNVKKCSQCTQWVMHGDHELLKFVCQPIFRWRSYARTTEMPS